MTGFSDIVLRARLRARPHIVPIGRHILPRLPERSTRAALARVLRRSPQMWGLREGSERLRCARCSYQTAFPENDLDTFIADWITARAGALATSMTHMARTDVGRSSNLIQASMSLDLPDDAPCVIAYLHYSIDPVIQLALLAGNPERSFKWAAFPDVPDDTSGWEDERALFLAGGDIPEPIAKTLLPVTDSSWIIDALRHIRQKGSVLLAIDVAFDSSRPPAASMKIGAATMPVSPAIDMLANAPGAHLIFVWPEEGPDHTWTLHHDEFADTTQLADAASRWIEEHHTHWAGWPYLACRQSPTEMRRIVRGLV